MAVKNIETVEEIQAVKKYQQYIRVEDFYNAKRDTIASSEMLITAKLINALTDNIVDKEDLLFLRGVDWMNYDTEMGVKASENDYRMR